MQVSDFSSSAYIFVNQKLDAAPSIRFNKSTVIMSLICIKFRVL